MKKSLKEEKNEQNKEIFKEVRSVTFYKKNWRSRKSATDFCQALPT